MKKNFIISTTNSLEGYEIKKYFGICSERLVIGTGLFSEFFAGFTDVFGGRSGKFEDRLREIYDAAMEKLVNSAIKKGANALLGVKMDIDEISGKNTQMFMISVFGTAVSAKDLFNRKEIDTHEESKVLSAFTIQRQIKTKALLEKFEKCNSFTSFDECITDGINNSIVIPLDLLIPSLNNFEREFTQYQPFEKLYDYLDLYDKDGLNTILNQIVIESDKFTGFFTNFCVNLMEPDYKLILDYIDKFDIQIIEEMILPILLKYKKLYHQEDIINIQSICDKLNKILSYDEVVIVKGMFNKDVWVCFCGKKIPINENLCSACNKLKNGLSAKLNNSLIKTINFLMDIKLVYDEQSIILS